MADPSAAANGTVTIADGVARRLDPKFVAFQRAVGLIGTAVISAALLIAAVIFWLTSDLPQWAYLLIVPLWLIATAALAWFCYSWPVLEDRHTWYTIDSQAIEIRRGVVWREVTTVPRSRVQHIDVSQGPIERSYNLGRLIIYTAGTDHARVELPGLNHQVALSVRDHLLPGAGDDAV